MREQESKDIQQEIDVEYLINYKKAVLRLLQVHDDIKAQWTVNFIDQAVLESISDSGIDIDNSSSRDKFVSSLTDKLKDFVAPQIPRLFPELPPELTPELKNESILTLTQGEYDEISKLSIKIDETLESITASQSRTEKDREEIKKLDEEINSLLESV